MPLRSSAQHLLATGVPRQTRHDEHAGPVPTVTTPQDVVNLRPISTPSQIIDVEIVQICGRVSTRAVGSYVMARHAFHGAVDRFAVTADFVAERFPDARFVADVAGGQGMLARLLRKRYNVEAEVIDPRGWTLKGVTARVSEYGAEMADYYDLIIGLHPDQALRAVVDSATTVPVTVLPCCNFWSPDERLGRAALLAAIADHHAGLGGAVESITLAFDGPMNRGLILLPPPPLSQRAQAG